MKRSLLFSALAIAAFATVSSVALADGDGPTGMGHRARAFGSIRHCLSKVDLTSDQKAAIDAILTSAKSMLEADRQALRADHDKLQTDISGGADKSAIGQDTLTAHTDAEKLKSDMQSVKGQILAKLPSDQQAAVSACQDALAPGPMSSRWNRSGAAQ